MRLGKLAVPDNVRVVTGFAAQVALGSIGFFCVAATAVFLRMGLGWLEHLVEMPFWFLTSADAIEIIIWMLDIIVFALFLLNEVRSAFVRTTKGWNEPNGQA